MNIASAALDEIAYEEAKRLRLFNILPEPGRGMPKGWEKVIVQMLQDDNDLDNDDDKKYSMAYHQVADCFFIGLTTNTGDPAEFWRPVREELFQRLGDEDDK